MAAIRFEGLCAIAALGFALNVGIARADPIQITDPEVTVVSSDNIACDGDIGALLGSRAPRADFNAGSSSL